MMIFKFRRRFSPLDYLLFLLIFLINPLLLKAQTTDSLVLLLRSAKGVEKTLLLNEQAKRYAEDNPAKAIDLATEALHLARLQSNKQEEAKALRHLGDATYHLNNIREAIMHYVQSGEVERELGGEDSEGYASRIADVGYCYYMLEQPTQALKHFNESLEISVKNGYDLLAAGNYVNIGNIYTKWGDYGIGLENFKEALKIDRRLGDSIQVSTDLNNIGKIFEHWGLYDEAIRYYTQSLEIARKAGKKTMIAIRLNNLGIVNKNLRRFTEALDYFHQALVIEKASGNKEKIGKRLSNIGLTYLEMGEYAKSLSYLDQALPILKKSGLNDELGRLLNIYGRYFLATKKYHEALGSFRSSQKIALHNNIKPLLMNNFQGISQAWEELREFDSALIAYKQFAAIKDSVFSQESNTKLAEFQARFENERMQKENEVLKRDAKINRNRALLSAIGVITLIIVLVSMILILKLKSKNSHQSMLMAKQQAERLKLELELKNNELTCNAMSIIRRNEAVSEMMDGVEQAIRAGQPVESLHGMFERIRNGEKDNSWKEFEIRFAQVHKEFYDRLNERFPDLTPNERKLCAFLRLNMTTKDIASITRQSPHSINMARTRLRKRMNLSGRDENLIGFLINL